MRGMTISRAAAVCGGRLCGEGDFGAELGSVVIDSRAVSAGDFFVAYKGERVDGHDYISAAFDRGAVCCLAQRVPEGETRLSRSLTSPLFPAPKRHPSPMHIVFIVNCLFASRYEDTNC